MANSTTNLTTMTASTAKREVVVNALADASSPATFGGRDELSCTGLTWAYFGGTYISGGVVTQVANGTLALTASTTNYVEFDQSAGTFSKNTSAFTSGRIPLYQIVCGTATVTSYTDKRVAPPIQPRAAVSMGSDANKTLTADEARSSILDITSTATLTLTRNIVLPLMPQMWVVYNGTTGSQSLQFIGATGTGITVANAKRCIIAADGTNIVRVTADQ